MSKLSILTILTAAVAAPLASFGQAVNFSAGNENFQVSLSSVPTWGWGADVPVMVVAPPPPPRHHHHHHSPVVFHAPMIPGYVEEVVEYAPVPAVVAYPRHRYSGRRTKAGVSFSIGGIPVGLIYEDYDDDYDDDDYYYAPPPRYKHHKHHKHQKYYKHHKKDKHDYKKYLKHSKHYYKKHHRHHHDDDDD